ncbi:arsenate reductase family protein [Corallococcus sp. H22C18031201]|uniref:arsenate reductase family protein n=1 Tax=Citreicoccus inhibens TaxID=2849499 RepID=UPI000E73ABDC|nr:arsenate reductase family protein [Citreicoccus inhibens]MBU8898103.1 arsenate reductase family protein [Citreicoccus inhibens]RJS17991.1 arsenate reductase family protein [Corallococcus sp. H22C18031201]
MAKDVLLLEYSGCDTCRKARKWLDTQGVTYTVRPIVESPPTATELQTWIARSGLPVRKWLNTSGQSYRALGKASVDAASEAQLREWLAQDGKLVKRPVLITSDRVLVGFKPEAYGELFSARG